MAGVDAAIPPSAGRDSTDLAHVHAQVPHSWTTCWCVSGQQHHCVITRNRHKAQAEHISVATGVALQNSFTQGAVLVQLHLPALGFHLHQTGM
eukprot:GHUV01048483.1.p1 GENE.GHUV01048483.1~~GHUV01048483.1.p1  ORF type:complete len:107 (+),score=16.68 GHUV01048483.1:45-323(+)